MRRKVKKTLFHYFFPHESNNYKAKSLHASSIIFYICLFLVLQFFLSTAKRLKPDILGYATNITVEKILSLVNQERAKTNLVPLELSSELSTAATQKAGDMFDKDYWAHVSPTGTTPWQFITSAGYSYLYAGENLAKDFLTSEKTVAAWMNSSTHRANILKPEYTEIGLAVMNGNLQGNDTTLVVQEFGTRSKEKSQYTQVTKAKETLSHETQTVPVQSGLSQESVVKAAEKPKISIHPFVFTKKFTLLFVEFLLIVLFIDSIYIWRHKTARLTSHTISHIIFFACLLGAIGATTVGAIL